MKDDPRKTHDDVPLEDRAGSFELVSMSKAIKIHDGDKALEAFASHVEDITITPEAEKKLLRKIDMNLMPILCIVYALNYLDKTSLSYASIMGFQEDLHLKGTNYQWLGSMFYVGYLVWEYPTSYLLQRLPLAKWSSFNIIMWGAVLCLLAPTKNFGGGLAVRFFLGVFEAAVSPGFALFTSQWYTREEQSARTAIWFSFNGVAQIVGALIAYVIAIKHPRREGETLASWQILFIAVGLITVLVGVVFLYLMPDNQLNARFLTKEERLMAVERIRKNQQGIGNSHFKKHQFVEALTDPMAWAFVVFALLVDIPNGGLTNFFSQLIVDFGYTPQQSLLYGTPAGAVEIIALILSGYLGPRLRNRIFVSIPGLAVAMLGMLLIIALPLSMPVGRLIGYYLTKSFTTGFVALLSLLSSNVAGYTKKTTVGAMYFIAYCVGNLVGPQIFVPSTKPRYVPAEATILVCWGLCILDLVFIRWYYKRENTRKREQRARDGFVAQDGQEFMDLTDRENPAFEYSL